MTHVLFVQSPEWHQQDWVPRENVEKEFEMEIRKGCAETWLEEEGSACPL